MRSNEAKHSGTRRGEPVAGRRKEPPDGVDVLLIYGLTQGSIDGRVIELSRASLRVTVLHVLIYEWWLNLLSSRRFAAAPRVDLKARLW